MDRSGLLVMAGFAAATTAAALIGERRRRLRRDVDRVGFMPWTTIQAAGLFATVLLLALAYTVG